MIFGIIGVNPVSLIISEIIKQYSFIEKIVLFDDDKNKLNKNFNGISVEANTQELTKRIINGDEISLGISFGEKLLPMRKEIFHKLNAYSNVQFPIIKHDSCMISRLSEIDDGNIISFGVVIGHNTHLKYNSVFWSGAIVEHDCLVGESCYLAPNVTISGFAEIGECTLIGSGAVVLPEVKIGKNCLIGAGSVVSKNIPDNSVVAGVPAKIIRKCN